MQRIARVVICGVVLCCTTATQAAPLGLTLVFPDITTNYHDISYIANNSSNNFTVRGHNSAVNFGSGLINFDDFFGPNNYLNIDMSVTTAGVATDGTLEVAGDLTTACGLSGVLLQGSISQFGYDSPASDIDYFEFVFTITGGLMATPAYFGSPGSTVGMILDSQENLFPSEVTAFANDFISSLDGWANNHSDLAPNVPEPSTLSLMILAVAAVCRRRV